MKPKPFSIQHPFIQLAAVSLTLALWFLGAAVYVCFEIRWELAGPVANLGAALRLNWQIEAAIADLLLVAQSAGHQPPGEPSPEFYAASRRVAALTARYGQLRLPGEQRVCLQAIRQLGERMSLQVEQLVRGDTTALETEERVRGVRRMKSQIDQLAQSLAQEQLEELDASRARLREHTRTLLLLLAALGLFAALVLRTFQQLQGRHLWEPLEQLRRMTLEIRQGNLEVNAKVPPSVEVGPLVESFLRMAAELRAMRQSLEQKVLERTARLEAAQKQLLQTAKLSALGQLVSGMAHEMNNPLTSILGFSEVLLENPALHPQSRAHIGTIRDEALRLKNVLASLSSFARSAPHHTTRLDLREVLGRLVELRRHYWTTNRIRWHDARPPAPAWVDGDPDRLLQVLFNLVLNAEQAIQACPPESGSPGRACPPRREGDLWLEIAVAGSEVRITVRDTGVGMSPETLEHIFEPFFTTRAVGQGTGLGLSIVHGIVEQHHGRIVPESLEGAGTTITVILPRAPTPATTAAPAEALPPSELPRGGHALVIDDEEDICALVQVALERHGWRSTVLHDSTAVGAICERSDFNLVICDLNMPGKSGVEILRLLRETRPELAKRFLLITGGVGGADKESIDLSTVPVLQKPFTLAQLSEAMHAVMQHANAHQ